MRKVTRIDGNNALQAFKPKVRVAAYCRVSTDSDEQMASLEAQKDHYESYIKANPDWQFAGIYYDEGISGTKKENRTGLLRLLEDCENKKIDFIITKSVSRFARNTTDCIEMVRKLTDLGVFIYFEKENINTQRMEGELVLTILSSLAETNHYPLQKIVSGLSGAGFKTEHTRFHTLPMVMIIWMESYLSIKNRLKS